MNIKSVKSCHINHLLVLKVQEFEHVNGQWSMPWMADLEEGKQAVVHTESPEKTPSTGTPAETQPNSPTPGNANKNRQLNINNKKLAVYTSKLVCVHQQDTG